MNKTKIKWVKNPDGSQGYTWNPITGCLNHDNGLCKGGGFPCYAYRLANGRLKQRYLANKDVAPGAKGGVSTLTIGNRTAIEREGDYADPFYPRFWEERLRELQPIRGLVCELVYPPTTQKGIFVCDMGDLFGIGVPKAWTEAVLRIIKKWPAHRFYLLTKQPQNLLRWSPFPDNCYVGVTATNTQAFVEACNHLVHVKAKVIYLSVEPLLEWHIAPDVLLRDLRAQQINWLIIGGQTNPERLPKIEWLRQIVEAADKAGIRVFLKDNLKPLLWHETERVLIPNWARMAGECDGLGGFVLRQEMPDEGVTQCKGS